MVIDEGREASIDITGINIDIECARNYYINSIDSARVELLRLGCAQITAASPAAEEVSAQEYAKSQRRGRWAQNSDSAATASPSGAEAPSVGIDWDAVRDWFSRNWVTFAGLLVAISGSVWLVRVIDKRLYERKVRAVLVGASSSGKSELWHAWRHDSSPDLPAKPSFKMVESHRLDPIPCGKYTINPTLIDTVGAQPSQLVDQMHRRRRLRAKRVLIVVVAPTVGQDSKTQAVSQPYVEEQKGYIGVPMTVLGATRRLRPDLVVLFATKFDLLSPAGPQDLSGKDARQRVEDLFKEHRSRLQARCEETGVPFKWIVGSAKEGWGIEQLRQTVTRTLVGSRNI